MGAGAKKPTNIFKLSMGDDPKEVNNWRLWFATFSFGIMGAARGIDEGLISGTFNTKDFQVLLGLDKLEEVEYANVKGNVSAMVQIGSVAGALLAFVLADRIGRLWATRQLCILWIIGIIIFLTNNGSLGQVYAGRFIAGVGIGQTTVIAPVYISEVAPKSIRGLCTCVFAGSVYIGILLAYFSTYGSAIHIDQNTPNSWVIPTCLHIIFAGLIFILSWFNLESPRLLMKRGQRERATKNLSQLRHLPGSDPHVQYELNEIQRQLDEEREATLGAGWTGVLKEMFLIKANAYRLYLGLTIQLLSQWSGAGSITLYAQDFFALLGTTGQKEKLFATAIFGVVKFVAAMLCALFLVDVIGRKRSLSIGIFLQAISMVYVAAFLTAVPGIEDEDFTFTSSQKAASVGAIVFIYVSGFGWAMGWNSIQYLINAEIYPLRIRALSSGLVMAFHFVNQYGNSRAVPPMLLPGGKDGLTPAGTFWFFAVITLIGLAWAWFFIPETAGLSLEKMDKLFELRWWQIGRMGRAFANEEEARDVDRRLQEKEDAMVSEQVESAEKSRV
ncbi:hypothetical protein LTR70_010323 [Exophiala xenobiotica]|uniref:Major facilitator superfamily (MFS) profile domain-containing protein n=1 Tax=Lithohypha guttulata TaxID=1690604 RepID=A0ABR0JU04_9EURO|nr:hypothetical protein LTR24_010383 [Lithohypha guttulata]KAK5309397.1 hypothetical protein LTR70_010323 [Exophiala xenobiotica]